MPAMLETSQSLQGEGAPRSRLSTRRSRRSWLREVGGETSGGFVQVRQLTF